MNVSLGITYSFSILLIFLLTSLVDRYLSTVELISFKAIDWSMVSNKPSKKYFRLLLNNSLAGVTSIEIEFDISFIYNEIFFSSAFWSILISKALFNFSLSTLTKSENSKSKLFFLLSNLLPEKTSISLLLIWLFTISDS